MVLVASALLLMWSCFVFAFISGRNIAKLTRFRINAELSVALVTQVGRFLWVQRAMVRLFPLDLTGAKIKSELLCLFPTRQRCNLVYPAQMLLGGLLPVYTKNTSLSDLNKLLNLLTLACLRGTDYISSISIVYLQILVFIQQ